MKSKLAVFVLAGALAVPFASLWAAGGTTQPGGTVAAAPAVKTAKKHPVRRHKKTKTSVSSHAAAAPEAK